MKRSRRVDADEAKRHRCLAVLQQTAPQEASIEVSNAIR